MTIFFIIILGIVILIVFLLFLALITKKEYLIEREIIIKKPSQVVFDFVKLMRNQERYNVWVMKDPHVKLVYTGNDGTSGFTCAWEGNKQAGKGEQEFKKIEEGKMINIELRFEKPFKNVAQTYLIIKSVSENETSIKWQMVGENKFPLNLMNLIIDGMLGKDLEQSLEHLKRLLEQ